MTFPSFEPHPLLLGGHLQTLAGFYLPAQFRTLFPVVHHVPLDDGDTIVLHEDRPAGWVDGDLIALLIHGLAGCHQSSYMVRVADKLNTCGVNVFRMDMRGCGAGEGIARRTTHCGRSDDAAAAARFVADRHPQSATVLVGFSLGGAIALNLVGELGGAPCGNVARVIAICPPIDLPTNSRHFDRPLVRPYDAFFVRMLWRAAKRRAEYFPPEPKIDLARRPRRLRELDALITAPLGGFASVDEYYQRASPGSKLANIRVPTTILAAADDPVITVGPLRAATVSDAVQVVVTPSGGHLGFIGRRSKGQDGRWKDRRWMDARVVDWVTAGEFEFRGRGRRRADLRIQLPIDN